MFGANNFLDKLVILKTIRQIFSSLFISSQPEKGVVQEDLVDQHTSFCKLPNLNTPKTYSIKNEGSVFRAQF
jgi:hypothetical protein